MNITERTTALKAMSAGQILAQPLGIWNDQDLLNLADAKDMPNPEKRSALLKLALRSPDYSEMVNFSGVYSDLIELEQERGDYASALSWSYAALVHAIQHDEMDELARNYPFLIETHLRAGDVESGLRLGVRFFRSNIADGNDYENLAYVLQRAGRPSLALLVWDWIGLDPGQKMTPARIEALHVGRAQFLSESDIDSEIDPIVLQEFKMALLPTDPIVGPPIYLPPIQGLLAVDGELPEITGQIAAAPQIYIPDLIRLAFDPEQLETPGPDRAVQILRRLREEERSPLQELDRWLQQAQGDWRSLLCKRLGKIGGYTNAELAAWMVPSQIDTYIRNAAAESLLQRLPQQPEMRQEVVQLMRTLLTRAEAYEAQEELFISFLVGELADAGLIELYPEIEAVFREDRIDPTITDLAFVQEKLGLPFQRERKRDDGIYVTLTCQGCQRERIHFVQHVTVDQGSEQRRKAGKPDRYDSHVMDRVIICPKCGARDRYTLSPISALTLLFQQDDPESFLARLIGKSRGPAPQNPRVTYIESSVFDKPMHPLEGLDRYDQLIARDPHNAQLYIRRAVLLRVLHRYADSLASMRRGVELDATNVENLVQGAMAEHDFGDPKRAAQLYEEARKLAILQSPQDPYMLELSIVASQGLESLRKGGESPWQSVDIEDEQEIESHASNRQSKAPKRKKQAKQFGKQKQGKRKKRR